MWLVGRRKNQRSEGQYQALGRLWSIRVRIRSRRAAASTTTKVHSAELDMEPCGSAVVRPIRASPFFSAILRFISLNIV